MVNNYETTVHPFLDNNNRIEIQLPAQLCSEPQLGQANPITPNLQISQNTPHVADHTLLKEGDSVVGGDCVDENGGDDLECQITAVIQPGQSKPPKHLRWPPRVEIRSCHLVPDLRYYLWNIPVNTNRKSASVYFPNLEVLPESLMAYCQVQQPEASPELKFWLEQVLIGHVDPTMALQSPPFDTDQVLVISSKLILRLFFVCQGAYITCVQNKNLNDYTCA